MSKSLNKKIKGIIGIGAAPDFTNDLIQKLTKKEFAQYKKNIFQSLVIMMKKTISLIRTLLKTRKIFCIKKASTNTIINLLYGCLDTAVTLEKQIKILNTIKAKKF